MSLRLECETAHHRSLLRSSPGSRVRARPLSQSRVPQTNGDGGGAGGGVMNGCSTCRSVTASLFGVQAAIASRPPRRQTRAKFRRSLLLVRREHDAEGRDHRVETAIIRMAALRHRPADSRSPGLAPGQCREPRPACPRRCRCRPRSLRIARPLARSSRCRWPRRRHCSPGVGLRRDHAMFDGAGDASADLVVTLVHRCPTWPPPLHCGP